METYTYLLVGVFLILFLIWKHWLVAKVKTVPAGYKDDVIVPFTDPIELYFADVSSMSMKVRMCLAEACVEFKPRLRQLMGSYVTKSKEYLQVNPAGTVPVLVHHGHPIHESSEQMKYIATRLVSTDGPDLMPRDIKARDLIGYWIEQTSMYMSEIKAGPARACKKRPGNCVPFITMVILPNAGHMTSLKHMLHGLLICGFNVKLLMECLFFIFGVNTFRLIPKLATIVKTAKKELFLHLAELDECLNERGTKYINGDEITIADIGWATILERMDVVTMWDHVDAIKYSNVIRYWNDMKARDSYKEATRLVGLDPNLLVDIKCKIKEMKKDCSFYRNLFE